MTSAGQKAASSRQPPSSTQNLIAVIADEDTCVGFLMAGIGNIDDQERKNFMVVDEHTDYRDIELCFMNFVKRLDIGIILISQQIANNIRRVVDAHEKVIPTVLESPSKDAPYDPKSDSIMKRAQRIFHVGDDN